MNPQLLKRLKLRLNQTRSLSGGKRRYTRMPFSVFQVSDEVIEAVQTGGPVVALETTIYTHGFPHPDNVALASHLESVVRLNGGIPATIGVLHGVARVGLDPEELIEFASAAGKKETMKVSRRDLPYITGLGIAGKKLIGGTTISGTMVLARMAGIRIFGTGGLGGVHRGGENTMDISADLTELGRTPMAVISSGCKSFLDIPRTLEYLETQGVCVSTFADGRVGDIDLPAFWTRESGVRSPSVVKNEKEAAAIIYAHGRLRTGSGLFFANPIPLEYSLPKFEIDQAIEEAIQDAEQQGVRGHANTPFILERIKQITEGRSIPANRALIESNVARATKVAVELQQLELALRKKRADARPLTYPGIYLSKSTSPPQLDFVDDLSTDPNPMPGIHLLVAGSVAVDLSCDYVPLDTKSFGSPVPHTSNPAVIAQAVGGVGHNVATAAHLIGEGITVQLCSLIANDLAGKVILSSMKDRGLDASAIRTLEVDIKNPEGTAQYVAVNDVNKDLVIAMADMRIISSPSRDFGPWKSLINLSKPKWVVVDANWDESIMLQWITSARQVGANVAFEPVSVAKSSKFFSSMVSMSRNKLSPGSNYEKGVYPFHEVELATPNEQELLAIHSAATAHGYLMRQDWWTVIDALGIPSSGISHRLRNLTSPELVDKGMPQRMIQLLPFVPTIITKLGSRGVLMARLIPKDHYLLQSPEGAPYLVSRNMSGDSEIGGLYIRLFPAVEIVSDEEVVSVNGVGDTFLGVLVAGLAKGLELDENLINVAQKAAVMTLKSREAVSPEISTLTSELKGRI